MEMGGDSCEFVLRQQGFRRKDLHRFPPAVTAIFFPVLNIFGHPVSKFSSAVLTEIHLLCFIPI